VSAPAEVLDLVERFRRNRTDYERSEYNETLTRREFIDPFFKSLGWDIDNAAGYAEAYKDVVHEDSLKIGGHAKTPDYSFRIGGERKFFVEAKRPFVHLKTDVDPAYQLRRYGWSAKLALSVLTNFDEFAVYDCRIAPKPTDQASVARVLYVTSDEYAARWDEIDGVFSKRSVLLGSFDKFATTSRAKRGTSEVDASFLADIEAWRADLARNIALRNSALTQRELNFAVQATIDRLVFLRICEDRGLEEYGELRGAAEATGVYEALVSLFVRADTKYNSGLFHFSSETGRDEEPDTLTPALQIDDSVLKPVVRRLYYPESPYEFSVLAPDILGQVYEQFLGKVIRITPKRHVTIEEKPEVKKQGGVVYTPSVVVDYIVDAALGEALSVLPQADVIGSGRARGAHPLRILDPACGSGSFLIAAYQRLLDWYLALYERDKPKWSRSRPPRIYQVTPTTWRLTSQERKRILLAHVFGVDIDPQAVEVTKLSLLLKVLEGETSESLVNMLRLFHDRALPDLGSNVRCGNSLIGSDFASSRLFDVDTALRVNPFDWAIEFETVFASAVPGFDVVIGNPPYVLLQDEFRDDEQLDYFRSHYDVASFKLDLYHLFMERGLQLTRHGGRFSMIVPANVLTNNHLEQLRRLLLESSSVERFVVLDRGIFKGRSVDNTIFVTKVGSPSSKPFPVMHANPGVASLVPISETPVDPTRALAETHTLLLGAANAELFDRVVARCQKLGEVAWVNFGKQLRDRKTYTKDVIDVPSVAAIPRSYRPCYTGADVHPWRVQWNGMACLDTEAARRGGCWDADKQNAPDKLLTRQIGRFPDFAIDRLGYQCLNTMFMVNLRDGRLSPYFLLGVLNSTVIKGLWLERFYDQRRTFPKIKGTYLKELPVPRLDLDDESDVAAHSELADAAKKTVDLLDVIDAAHTVHERQVAVRAAAAAAKRADALATALFGVTEEEARMLASTVEARPSSA
jgi:SAM-dependent methyltransferase